MNRGPKRFPPPPAPQARPDVEIVAGLRAGLAVLARRPEDVVRVLYARSVRAEVAPRTRPAQSRGVPVAEVTDAELHRFVGSEHHEGLGVQARPRTWASGQELADRLIASRGSAIALDRVRNPYNVGAVLRSAAFFGLEAALLGAPAPHPGLAPTAVRVAEGAAEELRLARTTDLADTLARLRARGLRVYGADVRATRSAFEAAFGQPAVLVVGHEREGLADRVREQCDALVMIPGSGRVESLNVAVAAGVLMSLLLRRPSVNKENHSTAVLSKPRRA